MIVGINTKNRDILRKIMVFGLLPGSSVEIIQSKPVMVLQMDCTQIAIDYQLSNNVFVKKINL